MTETLAPTQLQLLVDGGRVRAVDGSTFLDVSPVTGGVIAEVASGGVEDAITAIEAASRAQPGWAAASFVERRRVLLAAADLLENEIEQTKNTFALETGGVGPFAEYNVHAAAATLREAAGLTSTPIGEILRSEDPDTTNFSLRRPAGVVLAIVPWNAPLILSARSTAIALALGNSVVLRPSENAPVLAGNLLASALERAGIPPGVVNVITSSPANSPTVITAMIQHHAVRRVVFIGSTAVGKSIAATAGEALTPLVAELGGKNATIVRADADLEAWVPRLAFAAFNNSGQICMCTDRIIAHRSIAAELTDRLSAFADAMKVGDPRASDTELGPVIDERAVARYKALVQDATAHGATVTAGNQIDNLYIRPTVLRDLGASSRYYTEEGFLPMVSVLQAHDDSEAIAMANSVEYGLVASVVSADAGKAEAMALQIESGAVHVNGPSVGDEPHVPFGGIGSSGFGRLGGDESLRFFTQQQTIYRHGFNPGA